METLLPHRVSFKHSNRFEFNVIWYLLSRFIIFLCHLEGDAARPRCNTVERKWIELCAVCAHYERIHRGDTRDPRPTDGIRMANHLTWKCHRNIIFSVEWIELRKVVCWVCIPLCCAGLINPIMYLHAAIKYFPNIKISSIPLIIV